jgi:hypothetical protein
MASMADSPACPGGSGGEAEGLERPALIVNVSVGGAGAVFEAGCDVSCGVVRVVCV